MRLPVCIDGKACGELSLERRGEWVVADARLPDVGRVVRLYICGDGAYYLGVPVPEGEGLRLVKRLSPAEARLLPRHPRCAGERPVPGPEHPEPEARPRHVLWLGGRPHYF